MALVADRSPTAQLAGCTRHPRLVPAPGNYSGTLPFGCAPSNRLPRPLWNPTGRHLAPAWLALSGLAGRALARRLRGVVRGKRRDWHDVPERLARVARVRRGNPAGSCVCTVDWLAAAPCSVRWPVGCTLPTGAWSAVSNGCLTTPLTPLFSLAGRVGFEPTGASFAHPNRLAGDPFRPLRHLPVYEHLGGEGGIRTPEAHRLAVFKTAAFNHSATSPHSTLRSTSNARA